MCGWVYPCEISFALALTKYQPDLSWFRSLYSGPHHKTSYSQLTRIEMTDKVDSPRLEILNHASKWSFSKTITTFVSPLR